MKQHVLVKGPFTTIETPTTAAFNEWKVHIGAIINGEMKAKGKTPEDIDFIVIDLTTKFKGS